MCEQDNKTLKEYLKDSNKFNVFKIFKCCENQHSDFLAYLLNPNENHGLSKTFLINFLEKICGENDEIINKIKHEKEEDIYAYREFVTNKDGRIDILITGKTFACVIENKFGSKQHKNQCEKYKEYIDKMPKDIIKRYIYLDVKETCEKPDKYKLLTYKNIQEIIEAILQSDITQNTQNILKQYIICLNDKYASDFGLTEELLENLGTDLKNELNNCQLRKSKKDNEPPSLLIEYEEIKDYLVDYVIDLYDGLIFKVCITFKSKKIEYPYRKILLNYEEFSKLLCGEKAVKEEGIKEFIDKYNSFKDNEFDEIKKNVNEFINKFINDSF